MESKQDKELITIPLEEYIKLQKKSSLLYALERYGVKACSMYKDAKRLINSPFFDKEYNGYRKETSGKSDI